MSTKVSVIVPVYNAEKFIERCVRSLFGQTLDDIEYIFINDCTPDNSIQILEDILRDYPHRINQVKIINLDHNSKQAAARKIGMQIATGDYMIHCDPDDWIELNMYETMYQRAIETGADIITCLSVRHYKNYVHYPQKGSQFSGSPKECLKKLCFSWSLCSKLVKRSLIQENEIYPFAYINCGEDLNTIIRMLYYANSIDFVDLPLYHYNQANENSITKDNIKKNIELYKLKNIELIEAFLQGKNFIGTESIISRLKFAEKGPLLWLTPFPKYSNIKYFCSIWKECHKNHRAKIFLDHAQLCYVYAWFLKLRQIKSQRGK